MTEWILSCWDGNRYTLPQPLSWKLEYGLGSPCDSFQVSCPWVAGQEEILSNAVRMTVKRGTETVFYGVVDECECLWSEQGFTVELVGRGLQALLLDNEAPGADYGIATLADILRRYVSPFGITLAEQVRLPAVSGFSVKTGSSCWQVLYQFARYHGGATPRFDRQGRLLLSDFGTAGGRVLDDMVPITKMVLRDKRYGVLSQVQVINRVTLASQTVVNEDFRKRGGCSGRVLTMPRDSGYQTMRYNGQFQLDQSAAELRRMELTLTEPFPAWPGELVTVDRPGWNCKGTHRVLECMVQLTQEGYSSTLILGEPGVAL